MKRKFTELDPKEWEGITDLPKDNPIRIAKESKLYSYIEQHPDDLGALMLGFGFTEDPLMENIYTLRIVSQAKANRALESYVAAIYACRSKNRKELADELARDMSSRYPIRGRIANLLLKLQVRIPS